MGKKSLYLPDFIIIGANKAGTTSIANYLNLNPKVKISEVKEPMFFSSTPSTVHASKEEASLALPFVTITLDDYSRMYENHEASAQVFGEASTAYLALPQASATLIKKVVPQVKIIAILREPVSRAVSAYKMCFGNGIEKRSFSQVVRDSKNHITILKNHGVKEYIRNGLYAQLLGPYFQFFDRSQLLILNYDYLKNQPQAFMEKISTFIGVDYFHIDLNKKYNIGSEHIKQDLSINKEDIHTLKQLYYNELTELQHIVEFDLNLWLQ